MPWKPTQRTSTIYVRPTDICYLSVCPWIPAHAFPQSYLPRTTTIQHSTRSTSTTTDVYARGMKPERSTRFYVGSCDLYDLTILRSCDRRTILRSRIYAAVSKQRHASRAQRTPNLRGDCLNVKASMRAGQALLARIERYATGNTMAARRGSNGFLMAGLPLVTFIIGGSYMLSEFVSGQVYVKDVRKRSKSLREFDLDEEHENIMKDFKEDFEIKRVPRPGE